MSVPDAVKVLWEPQPGPQTALLECPVKEVFYGGARGGGKTDGSLGDWMQHQFLYGENAAGIFFRRKFTQLVDVIARSKVLFSKLGAKYNESKAEWLFPNGARLLFRYLERDVDAENYQGHNYTRVYIEEVTNFPSPGPIKKLLATLRSAAGVPCGMRLTGNPGGPGHHWVKARYITPAPDGYKVLVESEEVEIEGRKIVISTERVFIPSKVYDNVLMLRNDPSYILNLRNAGSEALVKAWLEGNWDIIEGAFFDEFSEKHVLSSKDWLPRIPYHAYKFRAFDWGSAKPFSVGWYALSDGEWPSLDGWSPPKDALIKYREWYGAKEANVGLKMPNELIAAGILDRERDEIIKAGFADPSIFIQQGGPSIAEQMMIKGVKWWMADNKRIPGWSELRSRLRGQHGQPMLYFFDSCVDTIRTLPTLQHDETNSEDVDTEGEDHAGDETRYACMSRPWQPHVPFPIHTTSNNFGPTFNELLEQNRRKRLDREYGI